MKTIGLIGGMSWESTLEYYRLINELVKERLNKLHSARILLYSLDFEEIARLQRASKWKELGKILGDVAAVLEAGGADVVLICTNTMHKVADEVRKRINVPLLDIIDVTSEKIRQRGLKKIGLLGTKFTMEDGFYTEKLKKNGIEVIIPNKHDREEVHKIIFEELCRGIMKEESKHKLKRIGETLISKGAEGIILGCTEIPLLINQQDFGVPVFDTTKLHAEAAVEFALSDA
jgi:aspartate racemase